MENIKVKKAPKKLKAQRQVQVCQLSFNYCKETPYWQADNFVFWAPCPYFVAFGIIYQLED